MLVRVIPSVTVMFQFPLHRDPRCNKGGGFQNEKNGSKSFSSLYIGILAATPDWQIQFPLMKGVSVPFTSGSSLQPAANRWDIEGHEFQLPLHRDPRCNGFRYSLHLLEERFSSLYIGILAATS